MKTRITELLGIKHPIVLAGMSWISEPNLVAAVCNAGGLGILAIAPLSPAEARRQIIKTRSLTDKPFGINETLYLPNSREMMQIALEERVPVINYSLGRPWFIEQVHAYGGKVVGTVATAKHAVRAEQLGCDAIAVTGFEAAAHGADPTSMVLIPLVAEKVKVPIIAAGGFFDGRGLAAALVLGAEAISMGTRFAVTRESVVHSNTKQAIIRATELDTLYSDAFDGSPGRVLRSRGAEKAMKYKLTALSGGLIGARRVKKALDLSWGDMMKSAFGKETETGLTFTQQFRLANSAQKVERSVNYGDNEDGFIFSGQSQGGIKDIPGVAELINNIVAEAEDILSKAKQRYGIIKD
jgi:enoyl-[acyl-carrier protein] reductase II